MSRDLVIADWQEKGAVIAVLVLGLLTGIAVSIWGTWLTIALLTLATFATYIYIDHTLNTSEHLDGFGAFLTIATITCWVGAMIVGPLIGLFRDGTLTFSLSLFIR